MNIANLFVHFLISLSISYFFVVFLLASLYIHLFLSNLHFFLSL